MASTERSYFEYDMTMTDEEEKVFDSVLDFHEKFHELIAEIEEEIPSSRERSLVITKLQEADMWMGMVPLS